jgi:cobalamin synthase
MMMGGGCNRLRIVSIGGFSNQWHCMLLLSLLLLLLLLIIIIIIVVVIIIIIIIRNYFNRHIGLTM